MRHAWFLSHAGRYVTTCGLIEVRCSERWHPRVSHRGGAIDLGDVAPDCLTGPSNSFTRLSCVALDWPRGRATIFDTRAISSGYATQKKTSVALTVTAALDRRPTHAWGVDRLAWPLQYPCIGSRLARVTSAVPMRGWSTGSRGHCSPHASVVHWLAWPLQSPCIGRPLALVATAVPMRRESTGSRGHCSPHASVVHWLSWPLQSPCIGRPLARAAGAVAMHRSSTGSPYFFFTLR